MRGGEPLLRRRGMIASRSVNVVRHPRGSYIRVTPILSLECPHQKTKYNSLALSPISKKVGTRCRSSSYERWVLGRTQFILHATRRTPHGASHLVQAMFAWLVKTRRAPSRHSRDARVYGHTTTAMHNLSTPPPALCMNSARDQRTRKKPTATAAESWWSCWSHLG